MKRARAFTLIEIAVVLFIIALLAGTIAQYLSGQIASAKQQLTQTRETAIKTAIMSFVARNYRLPCPAVGTIPAGGVNNGVEATNPGVCTGTVLFPAGTPVVATGTVPWVSLGLPAETSLDGYGNRFTYQVTLAATSNALNAQTLPGLKGNITIHSAGPALPANQINDCTPVSVPPVTYNPCSAVAVVVSHGSNGFGAYMDNGSQVAVPPGADELENVNADTTFVVKAYSGAQANPFDDAVIFMTAGDVLAGLNNSGALQDSRAIVAANFNVIRNAIIGSVTRVGSFLCVAGTCAGTVNCMGGTPCEVTQFTYTLPAPAGAAPNTMPLIGLPANVLTDPWGNPIQYTLVTSPIAPATVLSQTAFTLTSYGPDGTGGNADDISVAISVGEFQTVVSKSR